MQFSTAAPWLMEPQSAHCLLRMQALQQMHKILGQVDIVGVPFTLGSSLIEGVTSLVVAPTRATTPQEFFGILGRGFFILFRNAAYGIMHALGQVHILGPSSPHGHHGCASQRLLD